ncbi:MAG: site-2 protease family protein [Lachnospiraceae bacterium]|nr:site-2 protease family protein [Lachnospiraceae bacterium]
MIVSIILFFLIIGLLIISHEFGHYIVGRMCGVRVNEFTVGFGPKLFSFKKGETLFALRLLPLGGACIFDGMEGIGEDEKELDEHALPNVSPLKRAATLFAGPFANFLLAFVFALVLVGFTGVDLPVIGSIIEGSAAEEAGLMQGDMITRIDGEHVHLYREVSMFSSMYDGGKSIEIEYERDGARHTVVLTPKYDEQDGRYYIGIRGGAEILDCNPFQVFQYALYEVQYWMRYTVKSLGMIFTGKLGIDALSGPVGMAEVVNDTYEEVRPYGFVSVILTMMNLLVLLSVNVGIINLVPLPAFDGGRLIFALIELITGRRVPPEKEGIIHLVGIVAIILLMVVVMYHDIARLFK